MFSRRYEKKKADVNADALQCFTFFAAHIAEPTDVLKDFFESGSKSLCIQPSKLQIKTENIEPPVVAFYSQTLTRGKRVETGCRELLSIV